MAVLKKIDRFAVGLFPGEGWMLNSGGRECLEPMELVGRIVICAAATLVFMLLGLGFAVGWAIFG